MPRQIVLPPDNQYSTIETFSANTAETINKIMIHMVGSPPVTGNNSIYGTTYDLSESIEYNPCIMPDSFVLTKTSNIVVTVGTGECFINGVYIKTTSSKTLDTNVSDSYLDGARAYSGIIYILVKYTPTALDPKAYVGLIKKATYTSMSTSDKKKYLFLGALLATYGGSNVTDITPYYYDPNDDITTRSYSAEFADGGWLDLPQILWHP